MDILSTNDYHFITYVLFQKLKCTIENIAAFLTNLTALSKINLINHLLLHY